jgi:hypothetical protein
MKVRCKQFHIEVKSWLQLCESHTRTLQPIQALRVLQQPLNIISYSAGDEEGEGREKALKRR